MLRFLSPLWLPSTRAPSRRWWRQARQVDRAARELEAAPDSQLLERAAELGYRTRCGESPGRLLVPALALVVEAARRTIGLRHFEVQIVCGIALCHDCVAEMQTGEGKTLVATLPLFFHALSGRPVHLATANDYLAQRDADWMRPVFEALGMSVGVVTGASTPEERRCAWQCDITYATAREIAFDFLRDRLTIAARGRSGASLFDRELSDNTVTGLMPVASAGRGERAADAGQVTVQRLPFYAVLIDEADSLLIDEARTPLIVSGPDDDSAAHETLFRWAAAAAQRLDHEQHLYREGSTGRVDLTRSGYRLVRAMTKPAALAKLPLSEIIEAVVRAAYVASALHRDQHYVIRDRQVQIVDEFTGRIAEGRRWRNGVHQAVEAREDLPISPQRHHCARITVQELFGLYERCTGMTGTAGASASEFLQVYGLPVVSIPPRQPNRRAVWPPRVFSTSADRWAAVRDEVETVHRQHRPVLIGTRTIEQSELLSELLTASGLDHQVLNARNHAAEAAIVAAAGRAGRITVATNMAGRGTDIRLDDRAREAGGLHVIASELHASSRIDRQLIGRCARQGDPGSCRQFMALEDEVIRQGAGSAKSPESGEGGRWSAAALRAALRAQRLLERRHEEERRLLLLHSREQARQLQRLGQDPFLDAAS